MSCTYAYILIETRKVIYIRGKLVEVGTFLRDNQYFESQNHVFVLLFIETRVFNVLLNTNVRELYKTLFVTFVIGVCIDYISCKVCETVYNCVLEHVPKATVSMIVCVRLLDILDVFTVLFFVLLFFLIYYF